MNADENTEYESLASLLLDSGKGFVILHQNKALGNKYHEGIERVSADLAARFVECRTQLEKELGAPSASTDEWRQGLPCWASGNGYTVWKREEDFITLFVSFDNPEDPSFVIAARAPLKEFAPDYDARDPWGSQWMLRGEW